MRQFRFSLAGLFGLVTFAALNFAAVRYSVELWAAGLLLLIIAVLLVGVLGILYRRAERRAFWSGLTLFGAAYMLLALAPGLDSTLGKHLLTSKLLHEVYERTRPPRRMNVITSFHMDGAALTQDGWKPVTTRSGNVTPQRWYVGTTNQLPTAPAAPNWEDVHRGGHSLFALVLCIVGGLLARYFYVTREDAAPSQ